MKRLLAGMAIALSVATAANAVPVELRSEISDADGRVTLGEIFDGAGSAGAIVVATRTGPTVVLDAGLLQVMARRSGLEWTNAQGLRRIVVRAGADGGGAGGSATVSAGRNVQVLTYARSLAAGEIVQPDDLIWARAAASPAGAPRDADAVIGMAARRPLREGATVSMSDVSAPRVISTGDSVLVTYVSGGVTLTLQGRAMGNASVGDAVTIKNLSSNRTFEAVAAGPGQALTGPDAQALRAGRNPLLAQR